MTGHRVIRRMATGLIMAGWALSAHAVADEVRFVPARQPHTFLADGSALPEDTAALGWQWNSDTGNGGAWETVSSGRPFSEILMLKVDGLEAGAAYEVFGYFWADGFDGAEVNERQLLPAQFGCTMAELQTYDGPTPKTDEKVGSWMVAPGVDTGDAYGYRAELLESGELTGIDDHLQSEKDGFKLVRARMGLSRAGTDGTLPVFFAGYPYAKTARGISRIDGVAVRKVDHAGPLEMGWKAGTRLHLAIRVDDPVTVQRELEANVDVNVLDEDWLTPLYYASSADSPELVRKLLEKEADPNRIGQSIPPLSAAATMENLATTKLLLDSGAEVPNHLDETPQPWIYPVHPVQIHPLLVAVRTGCVDTVKAMLDAAPDLKISDFYYWDYWRDRNREGNRSSPGNSPNSEFNSRLVTQALCNRHMDMAALLIDHGCEIKQPWKGRPPGWISDTDMGLLALLGIMGDEAWPIVERVMERGISPVFDSSPYYDPYSTRRSRRYSYFRLQSCSDTLMAATRSRHAEMVRRLLPLAKDVSAGYEDRLYTQALMSENREIIEMIRQRFPDAAPARWQPQQEGAAEAAPESVLRMFLPRTHPPKLPPAKGDGQGHVLAVISSPNGRGPGEALEAIASGITGWQVVDRELVATALAESGHIKPWRNGEYRMAEFGERVSADCIIIVSRIKGNRFNLFAFEVIEVATGMLVHREYLNDREMRLDKDLRELLGRAAGALDAASQGFRREAVTLLPFTSQDGLPNRRALSSLLMASVQRQIDDMPGMISLTRPQMNRLVEEQALQGKNELWGAAHMVEGGVSAAGEGRIRVALRLETFQAKGTTKIDASAEGRVDQLSELTAKAWNQLISNRGVKPHGDRRSNDQRENDAEKESKRLLCEAQLLYDVNFNPDIALSMAEAGMALGAPAEDGIPVHLQALFAKITSLRGRGRLFLNSSFGHFIPSALLESSDRLAYDLNHVRQLLQQTSFYLSRDGERLFLDAKNGSKSAHKACDAMWDAMVLTAHIRSILKPSVIPQDCRDNYREFCDEQDSLLDQSFELMKRCHPDYYGGIIMDTMWGNPKLKKWHFDLLLCQKDPIKFIRSASEPSMDQLWHGYMFEYHEQLATHLSAYSKDHELTPEQTSQLAWMKCMPGANSDAPRALMAAHDVHVRLIAENSVQPMCHALVRIAMPKDLSMPQCRSTFDNQGTFQSEARLIPSLFHMPRLAPDYYLRREQYHRLLYVRSGLFQGADEQRKAIGKARWRMKPQFTRMADLLIDRSGKEGLLSATHMASLHEMLTGVHMRTGLEMRHAKQFSEVNMQVEAHLLLDFGKKVGLCNGHAIWPMVDNANPNILWMFYGCSPGTKVPEVPGYPQIRQPYQDLWLMAVDCVSGQVIHQINLKQETEKALGIDLKGKHVLPDLRMAFDQTQSHIMTNVEWETSGWPLAGRVCLIIDKSTGATKMLPEGIVIGKNQGGGSGQAGSFVGAEKMVYRGSSVIGIGDDFYFVDELAEQKGRHIREAGQDRKNSVFRLNPRSMTLTTIVQNGRRPAETPFDAENWWASCLSSTDGNLMVYGGGRHVAFYHPVDGSWHEVKNFDASSSLWRCSDRLRHEILKPIHQLKLGTQPTGWKVAPMKPKDGSLVCVGDGGKTCQLSVNVAIPADYRANTHVVVWDRSRSTATTQRVYDSLPFEQYEQEQVFPICVLNQTETDLILGLQVGPRDAWKYPTRDAPHLPFLWRVPKKELLKSLGVTDKAKR